MTIFCQATGTLVCCNERDDGATVGRIVTGTNERLQFTIRRNVLRQSMRALPIGAAVTLGGVLECFARLEKSGKPYLHRELTVSLVQPVQPPADNFLQSVLRKAKP